MEYLTHSPDVDTSSEAMECLMKARQIAHLATLPDQELFSELVDRSGIRL